jgi:ATP/maltotriose-dependent transcriptional regulator MalT
MAAEPTPATAPGTLSRTGTIRRVRLLDALDGARAPIRMLVAQAGYGKTVLASEWSAEQGRTPVWCPVRPQHVDVAALAVEVARRADAVASGCGRRLRERLATSQEPAVDARIAAEMLAEDLLGWPPEAWLVLDDYHHLIGADDAELFVHELVSSAPINVLVTTRERPSWVTTRDLIYGDVFELGQAELAMTREEAGQLLADRPADERDGLIALADGWPAVIGLARRLPRPVDLSAGFPDEVYDFFAEEVYQSLAPEMRRALCLFALAPSLDRQLAAALAGPEVVETVTREAESMRLVVGRDEHLTLHPLARAFLLRRSAREMGDDRARAIDTCLGWYHRHGDWDPLFELIVREQLIDSFETALEDALYDLLNTGRLATLRALIKQAQDAGWGTPVIDLARAEIALRDGNNLLAAMCAASAYEGLSAEAPLSFKALTAAARAAHLGNDEEEASALYKEAEANARTEDERREARWGLVSALSELERPEAWDVLSELRAQSVNKLPSEVIKTATRTLLLEMRSGAIRSINLAERADTIVDSAEDPFARCSFRSVYAGVLAHTVNYEKALQTAEKLREDAHHHRLTFVLPYADCAKAQALCGLRRYDQAEFLLNSAFDEGRRIRDAFLEPLAAALLVRLQAQIGRVDDGLAATCDLEGSIRSIRGEYLASRSVALACVGRIEEALSLADVASAVTRGIEARVLSEAARAIAFIKGGNGDVRSACQQLLDVVEDSNGLDLLVSSYRSSPDLLAVLLRSADLRARVARVIRQAGDSSLLREAGVELAAGTDPVALLSAREVDVYELMCRGLSNRQIASYLFISEATVKVHAHHIYDKLGIRSRHALALDAARRRATHATDAT